MKQEDFEWLLATLGTAGSLGKNVYDCTGKTALESAISAIKQVSEKGLCSNFPQSVHNELINTNWIDLSGLDKDCKCVAKVVQKLMDSKNSGLCEAAGIFDGLNTKTYKLTSDVTDAQSQYTNAGFWSNNPSSQAITFEPNASKSVYTAINPKVCNGTWTNYKVPGTEVNSELGIMRLIVHDGIHATLYQNAQSQIDKPLDIVTSIDIQQFIERNYIGPDARFSCAQK